MSVNAYAVGKYNTCPCQFSLPAFIQQRCTCLIDTSLIPCELVTQHKQTKRNTHRHVHNARLQATSLHTTKPLPCTASRLQLRYSAVCGRRSSGGNELASRSPKPPLLADTSLAKLVSGRARELVKLVVLGRLRGGDPTPPLPLSE